MPGGIRRAAALAAGAVLTTATAAPASSPPSHWRPPARLTWYWQLQGRVSTSRPAAAYDIDGFDTRPRKVQRLHALGRHVICYIDAGSWENWRPDSRRFPRSALGRPNGWPGERWLDIRRPAVRRIMARRLRNQCRHKGFDAIEPDNIDGYENHTGFPITARQQLAYDEWIAHQAHLLGLAVFEKNDADQARALEPHYDGVLAEQCNQYRECSSYRPYLRAGKPVLDAEYRLRTDRFCRADARRGIMAARYDLALDGSRYEPCW